MADYEKYGFRDATYSGWHRTDSISRFVDSDVAESLSMIDVDGVLWTEFGKYGSRPYALIETARDVGQSDKPANATMQLGEISGLPAIVLLYKPANKPNPFRGELFDIESVRIKRLWPHTEYEWRNLSPQEWVETLIKIRAYGEKRWRLFCRDTECPICQKQLLERVSDSFIHRWCPMIGHFDSWKAFDGLTLKNMYD